MRNTKWMRFLLITLSVVMVLSLFACGNGTTEEETTVDNTNDETTVEDTTVADDTTVEDTTVEDTTVEDTTVEDTTVEDTTVEDTTVEDTTVEDTTVEDTTVEDTTVEETTVEEEETVEGYISGKAIYNAGVHATYTATLNADGTVTVTSNQNGADQAIDLTAFATITAKYMVVKYKTEGSTTPYVYATTTSGAVGGYANGTIVADGEWHYMAVDLTKMSTGCYVLGEAVTFLRLDICEGSAGESMTIEYVQLMDDISEIEHLLPKTYITNIDHIFVNGNQDTDYKSSSSVTATSVYFNCWTAVDGCTATAARYVVTDANGDKTIVEIPLLTKDDEADLRFFTRDDITDHVINVKGYSADTLGYVFNVTADLSAFAGQTVAFTLVIETADGAAVSFHRINVTVPAAQ